MSTNLQEVGKVFNKNLDSILKRNAFDKIADTVRTLDATLAQMAQGSLLSDEDILNQLTLASETAGVDLEKFGITVDSVRTALEKIEPGAEGGVLTKLIEDMADLGEMTRTRAIDMKKFAQDLKVLKEEFKEWKSVEEFTKN